MGAQNYLELLRVSEGTLSRGSRLHLQSLAPINPHWARVMDYVPFSLCVIHKEGLYPSSGDINRLKMIMMLRVTYRRGRKARRVVTFCFMCHHRHQPINVLTPSTGLPYGSDVRRTDYSLPRGPRADLWVLTTVNAAETNG
jgi:hypothetical protein